VRLREEHRQKVFENRVLRDEVMGEWRKLHNEELCDLYSFHFIYLHVKDPLQVPRNRIQTIVHYIYKIYEHIDYKTC
jgi:hypothetical protein